MEKFVVFGRYCEDAITKREPFREQHLKRLKKLKDSDILVTLGPTTVSYTHLTLPTICSV